MTEKEVWLLNNIFPGRRGVVGEDRINISKMYEVHYAEGITKVYKNVNLPETDNDEIADQSGFIGIFHRKNHIDEKYLEPFTLQDLALLFHSISSQNERNEKLASIMRNIKSIDRDGNGYVTSTELDDILKLTFPDELTTKRLKPIFKDFASIQNRILIDYKKFRDSLLSLIGKYKEAEEIKK